MASSRWPNFGVELVEHRQASEDVPPGAQRRPAASISTTSVAIELDQPLVADPEVMRDLVEHDVPDLAA